MRSCPLCGRSDASLEKDGLGPLPMSVLRNYWVGFSAKKPFYSYFRCECGILYCKDYPNLDQLNELYGDMKDNEHSGSPDLEFKTKKDYAKILKQKCKKNRYQNVLEIGADNGRFAEIICDMFDVEQYHCVEPNIRMHGALKNNQKARVYSDISGAVKSSTKFDLIIAIHVSDHIPNLLDSIGDIMANANDGCEILVVVHNERSLLASLLGSRWPAFCLQHPHLFNQTSLKRLLEKVGFSNVEVVQTINYFSVGYLLEHLLLALFRSRIKMPSIMPVRLKLGNIAAVGIKNANKIRL